MKTSVSLPGWRRALATVTLGGLLIGYVVRLHDSGPAVFLLTISGVLLVAALGGLPLSGLALGSLGAAYLAALVGGDGGLDPGAPLFGTGLLVLAELLYPDKISPEVTGSEVTHARAWTLVGTVLGGFALASVVLSLGSAIAVSGPLALAASGLLTVLLLGSVVASSGSLLAPLTARRQDR